MKSMKRVLAVLISLCMILTMSMTGSVAAVAATGQPFASGTGGSSNFRIPAIIAMDNGVLVAAADARYSGTGDSYGLDTMVSTSTDGGGSWNYSYVNLFDDSAGYNTSASAFIDPSLVQAAGNTVLLFADVYSAGGHYIANIKEGTGYVSVGGRDYLALYSSTSASASSTPSYYVDNTLNSDGYYTVYSYSDRSESGYALDGEYDIYTVSGGEYTAVTGKQIDNSSKTINANVFYTGTANPTGMYVLGTCFLSMRKGTVASDGSIEWGELQLINDQVKGNSETFYGVGPGGAYRSHTGRLLVPLYTYKNSADGACSVIYSDDNGSTWTRGADMNVQTSEGTISEVKLGDSYYLYMFTRHGGYFVSSDNGSTWSNQKSVSGISYDTGCCHGSLTYSQLIDGRPAIILSVPSSSRTNGRIFTGLVQEDGTIDWAYTYNVNNGTFQYSDLCELSDGSIGMLYENGSASITFTKLAIEDIASGAEIGVPVTVTDTRFGISITGNGIESVSAEEAVMEDIEEDYIAYDIQINGGSYHGPAEVTIPMSESLAALKASQVRAFVVEADNSITKIKGTKNADGTYTFSCPHFSRMGVKALAERVHLTEEDVTVYEGQTKTIKDTTGNYENDYTGTGLDESIALVDVDGKHIPGGVLTESVSSITSGNAYIIENNRRAKLLVNSPNGSLLGMDGTVSSTDGEGSEMWTITEATGGYYVQDKDGKYLNIGAGTAWLSDTPNVLTVARNGSYWDIGQSSYSYNSVTVTYANRNNSTYSNGSYYVYVNGNYEVVTGTSCTRSGFTYTWTISYDGGTATQNTQNATLYTRTGAVQYLNDYQGLGTQAGGWTDDSAADVGSAWNIYSVETTSEGTATVIEVTGVAEGTTSVVVGTTRYNITVIPRPEAVNIETTPFVPNTGIGATDGNSNKLLTRVVLSPGITYDVNLKISGDEIIWSTQDDTIASVDQNGTITSVAPGETTLTVSVDGEIYSMPVMVLNTGATGAASKLCNLHISGIADTDVYYSWNFSGYAGGELDGETGSKNNQSATYTSDGSVTADPAPFTKAVDGEAIYVYWPSGQAYNIAFYGAPYEGYALTFMSATNSQGQYKGLSAEYAIGTDYFKSGSSAYNSRAYGVWTNSEIAGDIMAAMELGCDGAQGFSRGSSDNGAANCDLQFRSEKLPTVTKVIDGIMPKDKDETADFIPYTEGMTAKAGDRVYFFITVTQYETTEEITYNNDTLVDNLAGATFVEVDKENNLVTDSGSNTKTGMLQDGTLDTKKVYEYIVEYEITDDDLGKDIVNTVDLSYNYSSGYSSGTFGGAATDTAKIKAIAYDEQDFVVDFGLPTTFQLAPWGTSDMDTITSELGADVSITGNHTDGYTVTYQPNEIMTGADTVTISRAGTDIQHSFRVYPASTVYYEEGFLDYTGSWTEAASRGSLHQHASELGDGDNYGKDDAYASNTEASGGTEKISTALKDKAVFSFTGTGMDLYANTSTSSGTMSMVVTNSQNRVVKLIRVDTKMEAGTLGFTAFHARDSYGTPVVSLTDLPFDTYKVIINHIKQGDGSDLKPISIDGVKIYGTLQDTSIYEADGEAYPFFTEIRNDIAGVLDSSGSKYASIIAKLNNNVLGSSKVSGVYFINNEQRTDLSADEVLDLVDNGPKNEIYLNNGMGIAFALDAGVTAQLGLKTLSGTAAIKVNGADVTISSTEMYYPLSGSTITVLNNTDKVVSVTDLKYFRDDVVVEEYKVKPANGPLALYDEEAFITSLLDMGYTEKQEIVTEDPQDPEDPVKPEKPVKPVKPVKKNASLKVVVKTTDGKVLGSTTVTRAGNEGETYSFTSEAVRKAAKEVKLTGYSLTGVKYPAKKVSFGKSATITLKAAKIPAKVKSLKVKAGKKAISVSWKKQSGVTGYQIAYKKAKASKYTYKTAAKASKTIKGLKKGMKYKVKVRAYKTVNGKKIYGKWSSLKTSKAVK